MGADDKRAGRPARRPAPDGPGGGRVGGGARGALLPARSPHFAEDRDIRAWRGPTRDRPPP